MRAAIPTQKEGGFGLPLVILLLAGFLIALSVGGVLAVRQLDQQRQIVTQKRLQSAFTATFGGLGFRGPSLRTNFSFDPLPNPAVPPGYYDLLCLNSLSAVGVLDPAHASVAAFNPASPSPPYWNGPYWRDSVDPQNRPVDGWGRPLQLRYITGVPMGVQPGWQFFSLGSNGQDDTGNNYPCRVDDLAYPDPPYKIPPIAPPACTTPLITFNRNQYNPAENVTITLTWPGGSSSQTTQFNNGHPEGNPAPVFANIPQGSITVSFVSDKRPTIVPQVITLGPSCVSTPSPISF